MILDQKLRYLIVGGINTVFGFTFFTLTYLFLEGKLHYVLIFLVSQIVSICFSHYSQRKFVWHSRSNYVSELIRFASAYLVATIFNVILLAASQEIVGAPILLSQFSIGIGIVVIMFFVQKHWTFSKSNEHS